MVKHPPRWPYDPEYAREYEASEREARTYYYEVLFRTESGREAIARVAVISGYSTREDIPKIIAIKYGTKAVVLNTWRLE
jgi:hypothetical protein